MKDSNTKQKNTFIFNKKETSLVSRAIQEFNKSTTNKAETMTNYNQNNSLQQRKGANPPKKRSVLGRGLSALMSPTTTIDVNLQSEANKQNLPLNIEPDVEKQQNLKSPLMFIPIDKLAPNPNQPRTDFDQKEIRELASSVRKSGILQPLIVREKPNSTSAFTSYEIVAGERRWRAAKEAGLISVPATVKDLSDQDALEIGIIENIQRQDLNPIEEALAYRRLIEEFGSTQEQISQLFGKDRSSISNTMRLLGLPEEIQKMLKERKLAPGHARALLSLSSAEEQIKLANILSQEKLSVREAERLVAEKTPKIIKQKKLKTALQGSAQDQALEDRLRRALGTKVSVNVSASGKGEVKISFFSRAEFENFLEKVGA